MASSRQASRVFENTYAKSKDLIDTIADQSGQLYGNLRRWVPKHQTAATVSAVAVVGVAAFGYAMGRRRTRTTEQPRVVTSAARMPELDIAPFFKFLKLWMLYRVATKD